MRVKIPKEYQEKLKHITISREDMRAECISKAETILKETVKYGYENFATEQDIEEYLESLKELEDKELIETVVFLDHQLTAVVFAFRTKKDEIMKPYVDQLKAEAELAANEGDIGGMLDVLTKATGQEDNPLIDMIKAGGGCDDPDCTLCGNSPKKKRMVH